MRYGCLLFVVILSGLGLSAQDTTPAKPSPLLLALRSKLNPETPPWSAAHVLDRCAEHLATINPYDRPRIRYFDGSDAPRQLLPSLAAALPFGVNSAAIAPLTQVPQAVPHTDGRIFWIDLTWYRWTPEVWEQIALEDPYFRVVPPTHTGRQYLQQHRSSALRISWFLYYVYDTSRFLKKNATQADDAFYYQLIYGSAAATTAYQAHGIKVPTTSKEFEDFWFVDFDILKHFPVDRGAIVDDGKSGVAYSNRILWRIRTSTGVYWRTFDVFHSLGDQDFVENPFPSEIDAGEHIIQDERGAQFYLLTDGKGARVEFGDPRAVRDNSSGARVLHTAASCIHCHADGIIGFRNVLPELFEAGAKLKMITPERTERVNQFYLQDRKLRKLIGDDQANYAEFIRDCNGLTTQESAAQFNRARTWYGSPVTLPQAARECGTTVEEFCDAVGSGLDPVPVPHALVPSGRVGGRLGRIILDGTPIPRIVWEHSAYQEASLLLLEFRKQAKLKHP